jgi:hypothetical protein
LSEINRWFFISNFDQAKILMEMVTEKQGLQKLTETEEKIAYLMSKKKISQIEIDELLSKPEKKILSDLLTEKINSAKGEERDILLNKIDEIIPKDVKSQFWENNHYAITVAISKHIEECGKMPTKNQIANDTGLSRQTVHKHLSGYAEHPLYAEQLNQFKFMADRVLAKIIKLAGHGDVKAARLYFDVMGYMKGQPSSNTLIKNQNNYLQINGTVLSQEALKHLNSEQLNSIEAILKSAKLEN